MHTELVTLRDENKQAKGLLKELQSCVSGMTAHFAKFGASSKSNSKTAYETRHNTKKREVDSGKGIGDIGAGQFAGLKIYSESSDQSFILTRENNKRCQVFDQNLVVNDFRLDSSMSQTIQPCDPHAKSRLSDKDSGIMGRRRCSKTPVKYAEGMRKQVEDFNLHSFRESEDKSVSNAEVKIKDFSDFKELLKDLRLSIHLSELSIMSERMDTDAREAEALVREYAILDKEIYNIADLNNQSTIFDLSPISRANCPLNNKKSQSLNIGHQKKGVYAYKLEQLRKSSNLNNLELKLKEIRHTPHNLGLFTDRLKKEISARRNKFEELKEFIL